MKKIIHNTETNEIIEIELTSNEVKQIKALKEFDVIQKTEIQTKEAARQAIADRLGLTADELKLLLG